MLHRGSAATTADAAYATRHRGRPLAQPLVRIQVSVAHAPVAPHPASPSATAVIEPLVHRPGGSRSRRALRPRPPALPFPPRKTNAFHLGRGEDEAGLRTMRSKRAAARRKPARVLVPILLVLVMVVVVTVVVLLLFLAPPRPPYIRGIRAGKIGQADVAAPDVIVPLELVVVAHRQVQLLRLHAVHAEHEVLVPHGFVRLQLHASHHRLVAEAELHVGIVLPVEIHAPQLARSLHHNV